MKQPTFFEGVTVAIVASVIGSGLYTVMISVFPGSAVSRLLIAVLGLGYVVYLLSRSRERIGRLTVSVAWFLAAGILWIIDLPLTPYLLIHIGLIWLIRSLYFYSGVIPALADLGINAVSLTAALWALSHSQSVLLSIWSFFLVQALFVFIPNRLRQSSGGWQSNRIDEDRFQRAYQAAEAALRKLSSNC
jgi:hypothetical protein